MKKETLREYATDLYSLIKHTRSAVRTQKNSDTLSNPKAVDLLHDIDLALTNQLNEFDDLSLIANNTASIKETIAEAAGKVAGFIDTARDDAESKMLRDDYGALSMIATGYTMLHTAALGYEHDELAELTAEHLKTIAGLITQTSRVIPHVVSDELDLDVADKAVGNTQKAWDPELIAS